MQRLYLKRAAKEDAELLFMWANDETVRRNAFHSEPIDKKTHEAWYAQKLADQNCFLYIAYVELTEEQGKSRRFAVGQVRLDVEEGVARIDYSIAKEHRGKGYGAAMIGAVEKAWEKQEKSQKEEGTKPKIKEFFAQVKKENKASRRVFEKNGYGMTGETEACVEYQKEWRAGLERPCVVICTHKSWNVEQAKTFSRKYKDKYDTIVITEKEKLTKEYLAPYAPRFIFFPHWSWLIGEEIYRSYECVVFHMTDLPFGRGGSPLQNLIVRGLKKTKISALRVEAGLDTGDIYLKRDLTLEGSADDILRRCSEIIFTEMIPKMLEETIIPIPQSGEAFVFRRRKREDGRLLPGMSMEMIYDYIRMLDAEGYPNAYMELGDHVLLFSEAEMKDGKLQARVEFVKKEENV